MRVVAILATFNEERFVGGCIDHLFRQGVGVYLIDNGSTDQTVAIARSYLGHGLIGIETMPRSDFFDLHLILRRKEELSSSLDADWFMHVDADEIRAAPRLDSTLAEALREVDELGFNAVNFQEFTFIPTKEYPNHGHPRFRDTMRW